MDINLRSVAAVTSLGGDLTSLRNLCMHFDFPRPLAEHSFQSYLKYLEENLISDCERCMLNAAPNLRNHVLDKFYTDGAIVDVPISIDGYWQKGYWFNSLLWVGLLLSIDTSCVIDYVVKSLVCFTGKKNKDSPHTWKASHAATCCISHHGGSGKMETDGCQNWKAQTPIYNFLGDGDSSSSVSAAVNAQYGGTYEVKKGDCIGHVQKRLCTIM